MSDFKLTNKRLDAVEFGSWDAAVAAAIAVGLDPESEETRIMLALGHADRYVVVLDNGSSLSWVGHA